MCNILYCWIYCVIIFLLIFFHDYITNDKNGIWNIGSIQKIVFN